mmetsp:Transcript_10754/g.28004  ORF Transcript_10754/g.28004 Transcript_10754/m.28004 type:complete len:336 (+) Transcript_10754:102-1109(+)|eukprot:CAMPEP_0202400020 /NCGR_PEP_ID=MMETSP1128-20130828/2415_1 /ASSEMBLY_ACC=CAM_ASM_000463 /TAXON_ID=3047 /ORGANISM="Dunaliella tertiolecta, Strain CCMP1320" /LENGTH=335 /DNA_ID=CAMNT_0049003461 /DNA_START=120 /DNA_END=1127 /DNA_ORIENTATION=+
MPHEMELNTDSLAERVQRAMIESSLAQGAGAYSSSKKRSAMDELYMDLKGLQLAKAGVPPEQQQQQQQQQQQAFNWEQGHLEWERAQQLPAARAAASRSNSSGGSKQVSFAARSASSTSSSSLQQWSGMSVPGSATTKAGSSQRQMHLPPAVPKPSAHISLPPPQPPLTQESAAVPVVPSSSSACGEGDQVEAAGPSTSSRWGAMQAKAKAALQKVHTSGSGSKGKQQRHEKHIEQEASQPAIEHVQGEAQLDDDPDVLPHHRRHRSHHISPAQQHSPSASFSSGTSASARAPRGLSSSLALPKRGTEKGGVLGMESFKTALTMLLGDGVLEGKS